LDQETLVTAQLTTEMLQAGEDLLRELDRHKFPAKTALWLYKEESDVWRLVIATPHLRSMGPLKNYKSVQKVMSKIETPLKLRSVALVDTKDRLIKGLSTPVRRRASVSGVRLSHAFIGGRFVEDAYIYRVAA
jgi:hypothetical protein